MNQQTAEDIDTLIPPVDIAEFQQQFQRLEEKSATDAATYCLRYMAAHDADPLVRSASAWAAQGPIYISLIVDPQCLPVEVAAKAIEVLKVADPGFGFRFAIVCSALTSPDSILRALNLVQVLGDYSILIAWLRELGPSTDARVRSRSAKLLCLLRPNRSLIHRQLKSNEARIRAGVLEVLWHSSSVLNREETRVLFRAAVDDPHHRVVANALVGLHRLGEAGVYHEMAAMCSHKQHLFRASMAWALGIIKDQRAIPTIRSLLDDPSYTVRQRAKMTLSLLETSSMPEH